MFFFYLCTYFSQHCIYNIVYTLCPTLTTQKNLNFRLEKHLFSFFSRVCVWTEKKKAKKDMLFFVNICTHTHIRRLCDIQIVVATSNELVRPSVRRFATQCYTMLHNGIELCAILQSLSISILRPLCVLSAFCHTAAIVITTTTCPFPVKVNQHVFASNLCAYAMVRVCVCVAQNLRIKLLCTTRNCMQNESASSSSISICFSNVARIECVHIEDTACIRKLV